MSAPNHCSKSLRALPDNRPRGVGGGGGAPHLKINIGGGVQTKEINIDGGFVRI